MGQFLTRTFVLCLLLAPIGACDSGGGGGDPGGDDARTDTGRRNDAGGSGEDNWIPVDDIGDVTGLPDGGDVGPVEDLWSPPGDTLGDLPTEDLPAEDLPIDSLSDLEDTVIEPYVMPAAASFVSSLTLPEVTRGVSCCYDFGGDDDTLDNALGAMAAGIEDMLGADGMLQGMLQDEIETGGPVLAFGLGGLDDPVNDDDVDVDGFVGGDADDNMFDNLAGTGTLLLDPAGFSPDGWPLAQLGGWIEDGVLHAEGSGVVVRIPVFIGIIVDLEMDFARLEIPVEIGANGVGLSGTSGKLGGYTSLEVVVDAMNAYVDSSCGCLGVDWQLFSMMGEDKVSFTGAEPDGITCDNMTAEELCIMLNDFGAPLAPFFMPDIDTNNNQVPDSVSFGYGIDLTSTTLETP